MSSQNKNNNRRKKTQFETVTKSHKTNVFLLRVRSHKHLKFILFDCVETFFEKKKTQKCINLVQFCFQLQTEAVKKVYFVDLRQEKFVRKLKKILKINLCDLLLSTWHNLRGNFESEVKFEAD